MRSDAELIDAARSGDDEAWADLYRQHAEPARRYAICVGGPSTADDVVAEAFTRILAAVKRGKGPSVAFRPYLLAAVRNVFATQARVDSRYVSSSEDFLDAAAGPEADPVGDLAESGVLADAFQSLPERWQLVLWHTVIEEETAAQVAVRLGIAANTVAALTYRAREGLRQAYLTQHIGLTTEPDCRAARALMPGHHRGALSATQQAILDEHLRSCADCEQVAAGLESIMTKRLAGLLLPALLGVSLAQYRSGGAVGGAGAPTRGVSRTAARLGRLPGGPMTAIAAAAVTVVLAVGAAVLLTQGGDKESAAATQAPSTGLAPGASPSDAAAVSGSPAPGAPTPPGTPTGTPTAGLSAIPTDAATSTAEPTTPRATPSPAATGGLKTKKSAPPAAPPPGPDVVVSSVSIYRDANNADLYPASFYLDSPADSTTITFHVPGMTQIHRAAGDSHSGLTCGAVSAGTATCTISGSVDTGAALEFEIVLGQSWAGGDIRAAGTPGNDPDPSSNDQDLTLSPTPI